MGIKNVSTQKNNRCYLSPAFTLLNSFTCGPDSLVVQQKAKTRQSGRILWDYTAPHIEF